nr:type II toxin-antitoxin system YafQ family toxin [Cardiobacterium valvarum]
MGHLLHGSRLPEKYRDHALTGNWQDYRDCHIKPDQVLIYRIHGDTIELHRMGTHAELFG